MHRTDAAQLRLAMVGATEGNGHPYSWSAIVNGYRRDRMDAECPFPGIPGYLSLQPPDAFGFPGVEVTHVACVGDGGFSAQHVADLVGIPNVVDDPADLVGAVDAVIVATDRGSEHVDRCRPFVEAGIPVFVDKPLATSREDLSTFEGWVADGARIMSSSSMRYCKEFAPYRESTSDLGDLRFVSITSPKSWEAYGIHALEAVYPILGPGFISVRNSGSADRNVVHLKHQDGVDVVAVVTGDLYGGFGLLTLAGTVDSVTLRSRDTFHSFKEQLADFIAYVRTGERPYPFEETVELTELIIAARMSLTDGGREVGLDELR